MHGCILPGQHTCTCIMITCMYSTCGGLHSVDFHHVLSFLSLTLFSCLLSLSLMSQILLSLTELVMGGEDCSPKQRLLRNMGAHTVVLDLLQVPYGKRDQRMTKIISHAHRFLQFFCQGDDQNQMILYRNMNSLLQSGNHVSHMAIT